MNRSIPLYSISAVAKTVGVPVATLRTWEDRYGLVVPQRSAGRHRLFSEEQLDQLRFVKARMEEGASAAEAHRLLQASHHDAELPAPAGGTDPGNRPMILLAEHDPFAAEVEERLLKDQGYQVHVALGMEAASTASGQLAPALVVLDLMLSGGLGLEFCRALKQRHQPPAVLAVSSLRSGDQAAQAGADRFLSKPLDPAEFTSVVDDLLRSNAALPDSA